MIIKSAFDGQFLTQKEEASLLTTKIIKNYNDPIYEYLTCEYEKWLVVLHLYVKEDFGCLLKYLQKELFEGGEEGEELLLRYNLVIVYLLVGEQEKALNVVRSLGKFEGRFKIAGLMGKMLRSEYEEDECLEELGSVMGIGEGRLLSSYLPFHPAKVKTELSEKRIFMRVSIPFPDFPMPDLQLKIDSSFILREIDLEMV